MGILVIHFRNLLLPGINPDEPADDDWLYRRLLEELMKITVDMDKCIGAGLCVVAAPKVFSQNDDDGLVIVLDETPPADQHEAVREAARLCPALVIKLQEDE